MNRYEVHVSQAVRYTVEAQTEEDAERISIDRFLGGDDTGVVAEERGEGRARGGGHRLLTLLARGRGERTARAR